ncbi:MAG: PQQ-binding-like beta-propeller repeat protein [Chlorobi bacterium]|nr:PQQ-binding-like beta-propeller repeat protein [Chlorobiota bacterium]MCI0716005.1 PQQ-binding-like beta-propeller repeat protein [Chlorobiota bacterium]
MFLIGCSGIKVEQRITLQPGDWVMAGGSPEQKNVSAYSLEPPLNLMWDFSLEGGVCPSGISVADAVVFVNVLKGEMLTIDVSTGGKIGHIGFLGKDANSAPLIFGTNVIVSYAGDKKYSLASYDLSKGEINWRRNYGYIQTSPIMVDGYIYFGNLYGSFYKVDASTGQRMWKYTSKSPVHSTCAVSSERVVFGNDNGFISCLSTSDGSLIWKIETGKPVISTPMINEDIVYIGGDDSNYCSVKISDGSIIWKNNIHSKIIGGSALFRNEDVIFGCVDGSVYSLNTAGGTINWKFNTKGTITSSPIVSGNFIYITSYDSYIYSLEGSSGGLIWSYQMENKSKTTPVVWKDYLFAAADDILYCFTNKVIEKKK